MFNLTIKQQLGWTVIPGNRNKKTQQAALF